MHFRLSDSEERLRTEVCEFLTNELGTTHVSDPEPMPPGYMPDRAFELKLGASTADRIVGTWSWVVEVDGSGRRETADIVIYRTGYGRALVMDFQNYQLTITLEGKNRITKPPVVWNWLKISKRELLWDEMPF